MAHLGGKGDHPVVGFGGGHRQLAEARRFQSLLDPLQKRHIVALRRHQHHGRALEEVGPGVFKARVVGTGHGMAAHIGKAVLLRQGEDGLADHPLGAAEIDDQGGRRQIRGPLPQILHGGLGRDGQQQQVAGFDGFGIQQAVDGPAHPGEIQHDPVPVVAEDGPARLGVGLGHGAADEAQAHNADGAHSAASRTARAFRATSANCSGVRDWAPSHQAWGGSLWTSIIRPSAPAAAAA